MDYTNKLNLRRNIREQNKVGQNMAEIQPTHSAQMFASDPSENRQDVNAREQEKEQRPGTCRFSHCSKSDSGNKRDNQKIGTFAELGRVPVVEAMSHEESQANCNDSDSDNFNFCDDGDNLSLTSEREVKFWENDQNKLANKLSEEQMHLNLDSDHNTGTSYDVFSNEEVNMTESSTSEIRKRTRSGRGRPSNRGGVQRKAGSGNVEFPDAVLTRDKRIMMSGIEIIKNPPGSLKSHPYSIAFSCGSCGKMVSSFWRVRQHICGHHLGLYNCEICGKHQHDPASLSKHKALSHSEVPIQRTPCPICGKPINGSERKVRYHQWRHLNEEEKKDPQYASYCPPEMDPTRPKRTYSHQSFMCSFCSKTYKNVGALQRHELLHAQGGSSYQCQYCGRVYDKIKSYHDHTKRCEERMDRARGVQSLIMYPCPKCPARLKSRHSRDRHMLKVHKLGTDPSLPLGCPKCPRRFKTKSGLQFHKKVCIDGEKGIIPRKHMNTAEAEKGREEQV